MAEAAEPRRRRWLLGPREPGEPQSADALRARYGVNVVYAGLAVVLIAFVVAVLHYGANDATSVLSAVTGVVGTIVGAYFGVQVGSQGKEDAERRADERVERADRARAGAERDAKRLAAVAPPEAAIRVLDE